MAYKANKRSKHSFFPYPKISDTDQNRFNFWIELVLFGAILTIGEVLIGWNHNDNTPKEIAITVGTSFVPYCLMGVILQAGGFYEHIFGEIRGIKND